MMYFLSHELKRQCRSFPQWVTAAGLFAAASFIVGWPLRGDWALTQAIGPSAILAFLVLSKFLVLSSFWAEDIRSGILAAICAHKSSVLTNYTIGRAMAGILAGWLYAGMALALGILFFSTPPPHIWQIVIQILVVSPAITVLSLVAACLVNGTNLNANVLGVMVLIPLLAPVLIFANIYWQTSSLYGNSLPSTLFALLGISLLYCIAGLSTLPLMLKSQA